MIQDLHSLRSILRGRSLSLVRLGQCRGQAPAIMPPGNNNSRIISCSHYTIINHASSYFRDPEPIRETAVVDVEGQWVGQRTPGKPEMKKKKKNASIRTRSASIQTFNIDATVADENTVNQ